MRVKENIVLRSMGKNLKVTAIFDNDEDANKWMERTDDAVIAIAGPYIFLANKYDKGTK